MDKKKLCWFLPSLEKEINSVTSCMCYLGGEEFREAWLSSFGKKCKVHRCDGLFVLEVEHLHKSLCFSSKQCADFSVWQQLSSRMSSLDFLYVHFWLSLRTFQKNLCISQQQYNCSLLGNGTVSHQRLYNVDPQKCGRCWDLMDNIPGVHFVPCKPRLLHMCLNCKLQFHFQYIHIGLHSLVAKKILLSVRDKKIKINVKS